MVGSFRQSAIVITSSRTAAVLAVALLGACGDSTSPSRTVNVAVEVTSAETPIFAADSLGRPSISCGVTLTATATGKGTASWGDGMYRIYFGKDRRTPVDTLAIPHSLLVQSWHDSTLVAGASITSHFGALAGLPFSAEVDFVYDDGASHRKHAKADFTCGPTVSADAAAPVITSVAMTPATGTLPAGSSLSVSFAANAQAGLWQTGVQVSGPCTYERDFAEQFQTTTSRVVSVPIASSCRLGVPITVQVVAIDAAAQVVTRTVNTSLVVADRQPPTIAP